MTPPTPHTIVSLYESNAGDLFIAVDDGTVAYDVTPMAGQDSEFTDDIGRTWREPGHFVADAVGLLNGDTDTWTLETYPLDVISSSVGETNGNTLIAVYDDTRGVVEPLRDAYSGELLAGHNGRRYIGGLDAED